MTMAEHTFTASELYAMKPADISMWLRETDNADNLYLLSLLREQRSERTS
jgi:hypothetical protein